MLCQIFFCLGPSKKNQNLILRKSFTVKIYFIYTTYKNTSVGYVYQGIQTSGEHLKTSQQFRTTTMHESQQSNVFHIQQSEVPCNRFCRFEKICGNMYECHTHKQLHVCDQGCSQLLWYDNSTRICRLSKVLWPVNDSQQGGSDGRKRGTEMPHEGSKLGRFDSNSSEQCTYGC